MALKVWLPLSGDITTNYGVDEARSYLNADTPDPTAVYGNGILGNQCLTFSNNYYLVADGLFSTAAPSKLTLSFWAKESSDANVSLFSISNNTTTLLDCSKSSGDYMASGIAVGKLFTLESGWNHIAVTIDGSYVKSYVNGALVNTLAQSGNLTANLILNFAGKNVSTINWQGSISNIKVYDNILSLFEIVAESNGLVLNYGFNGNVTLGTGVTLPQGVTAAMMGFGDKEHDTSGNEFDGTYGATRPVASTDTAMNSSSLDFTNADDVTSDQFNTTEFTSRGTVSVWVKGEGTIATFSRGSSITTSGAASEWQNLVFTNGKKYVNGVDAGAFANPIGLAGNCVVTIGGSFTGKISDFRIYAKQFTPEEIVALYKRKAAIDNTGKLIASEIVVTDDSDAPSFNKQGVVSAAALESWTGEWAGENTNPVDVTTFKVLSASNTIDATDVMEI